MPLPIALSSASPRHQKRKQTADGSPPPATSRPIAARSVGRTPGRPRAPTARSAVRARRRSDLAEPAQRDEQQVLAVRDAEPESRPLQSSRERGLAVHPDLDRHLGGGMASSAAEHLAQTEPADGEPARDVGVLVALEPLALRSGRAQRALPHRSSSAESARCTPRPRSHEQSDERTVRPDGEADAKRIVLIPIPSDGDGLARRLGAVAVRASSAASPRRASRTVAASSCSVCVLATKKRSRARSFGTAGATIGCTLTPAREQHGRQLRRAQRVADDHRDHRRARARARVEPCRAAARRGSTPRAVAARATRSGSAMQLAQRRERGRRVRRRDADAVDESRRRVLEVLHERARCRRCSRRSSRATCSACPSRCPRARGSTPACSAIPRPVAPSTPSECASSTMSMRAVALLHLDEPREIGDVAVGAVHALDHDQRPTVLRRARACEHRVERRASRCAGR